MGTVLVARGADVLLDEGYRAANLDWDLPNTPDVKFRIGSLTEQFTATLVLLLQEDGKLSIGDSIGKYLADAPKTWQKITLVTFSAIPPAFLTPPRIRASRSGV